MSPASYQTAPPSNFTAKAETPRSRTSNHSHGQNRVAAMDRADVLPDRREMDLETSANGILDFMKSDRRFLTGFGDECIV
jgi:hypothetical protein